MNLSFHAAPDTCSLKERASRPGKTYLPYAPNLPPNETYVTASLCVFKNIRLSSDQVKQRLVPAWSGNLPHLLSVANESNCDLDAQWQISKAIVRHFERGDDFQSCNILNLVETLKLAYRLRHHRLIDLVECICVHRFQESVRRLQWDLFVQTAACAPVESMPEQKARMERRAAAITNLLDNLERETITVRETLDFARVMRSDV
ncbi:hypothetical protein B0H19DRAFT_1136238 [Mycena capillaripes]|nr:hypothetical protein B0H19DRAFT_1136238 [Mycena capillaripes]